MEIASRISGGDLVEALPNPTLDLWAAQWLASRTLRPTTRDLYEGMLRVHLAPAFGTTPLGAITLSAVRQWHAGIAGTHPVTAAKAYRLLRAMLATAVEDGLLATTPCRIRDAAHERSPERPVASLAEVAALADAMPERLRALVLLATWCQMRRGELLGLRRRDIDIAGKWATVRIERARVRVVGTVVEQEPKTPASVRMVAAPPNITGDIKCHLKRFVAGDPEAWMFTGEKGRPLGLDVLRKAWGQARSEVGRPDLHLHDLRHTGLTWAAATGASTKEIMRRGGHSSSRAALIYQHATEDRDQALAQGLADMAGTAPEETYRHEAGTRQPGPDPDKPEIPH